MARRTPTEPASDSPTLHGHWKGLHDLDEHRHGGGDRDHGHADSGPDSLGRKIHRDAYISPDQLNAAREDLLGWADAPAVETQTVVVGELVRADHIEVPDRDFADLVTIVEGAHRDREHADLRLFEGQTLTELASLTREAVGQAGELQHVNAAVISKISTLSEGWLIRRGLKQVGS